MKSIYMLLVVVWVCAVSSSKKAQTRRKQYNLFNMKGVQIPTIVSNTTLSGKKNQLTVLSMTVSSTISKSSDWFFSSVQNIPKFVKESHEQVAVEKASCQLRLLVLGHHSAFHGKKNNKDIRKKTPPVYEGGLATVRMKIGQHVTLPCYYATGRNQHFVLVDDPHTLAAAVLCDIPVSSQALCDAITTTTTTTPLKLRLHIYASEVTSFAAVSAITHSNTSSSDSSSDSGSGSGSDSWSSIPPYLYGLARTLSKPLSSTTAASPSSSSSSHSTADVHREAQQQHADISTTTLKENAAVCTVQTFRNNISGIYLYLFAAYYLRMGYLVIIYDRFGHHFDFIEEFLAPTHPQHGLVQYHAYTALQLALPHIYTPHYASSQYFARHVDDKGKQVAMSETERMTQDQDKRRTYDMARLAYSQVQAMLFVDSDELLFCPPTTTANRAGTLSSPSPSPSLQQQQQAHRRMIQTAMSEGYDEIQVPRVSQFTCRPASQQSSPSFTTSHVATEIAMSCMQEAYYQHNKSLTSLFRCWSTAHLGDKKVSPKSIDLSSPCPFRYNHYSCAIHKTYRREKYRCHCKIKAMDVNECRIVHLNNKFLGSFSASNGGGGSLSAPLSDMADMWSA